MREGCGNCFEHAGYRIAVTDAAVTVDNESTWECQRVWGDSHVTIDGAHAFRLPG